MMVMGEKGSVVRMGGILAAGVLALGLSGCASTNPRDPYEGFNRAMFAVNEGIDKVAKPVAQGYDAAVPMPVKAGIGNFFGNVGDLWIGVNNGLQGKVGDGANDIARLLINSTLGIFGLFDVASEMGFEKHDEDFGQTLARWGVGDGGYLFWPIIGPRTLRDTGGFVVDTFADPVQWAIDDVAVRNSAYFVRFVDVRASLLPADKVVEEAALDKYAYIRDAYLQRRRSQIFDGNPPRLPEE
ncbi:MAG TPA: VacJ family lipoprotein [Rhodocyclaceae bacterium]|jgi:phospholipid-binding lipoprotein MlaA|nr:VacJ family lipoprotein [Rhodocyclaceae bacterium]HMV21845.1 VacJ family lipoprotein [Rhodocyclaceae bacterium]HNE44166.1 VacJ family lipoprotein [Rhodocyclaceae bacterium]HNL21022.1 VacJ family lipoprotein [Rhodocyclaceae bacterium]HNM22766.1 VacJ family lipoprotein [Rhodocyclaceae bacterium]